MIHKGALMSKSITVGRDLAKNVFQVHGANASGTAILSKKLPRARVQEFFGQLSSCVVGMEACGGTTVDFKDPAVGVSRHDAVV